MQDFPYIPYSTFHIPWIPVTARLAFLTLVVFLAPVTASGQVLPSEPFSFFGDRVVIGGEASATIGPVDTGYFNDTNYGDNVLRLVTVGASTSVKLSGQFSALAEFRLENDNPRTVALFVRYRPWDDRHFDIQVGRIPPVFGTFGRRSYGPDNPLIGHPLAYQYLTTIRPDATPTDADGFLNERGDGWLIRYPNAVGAAFPASGTPLVSGSRWDTGISARIGERPFEVAGSVTNGSLGVPRFEDDNEGKQVALRVALRPSAAWVIGVSGANGARLSDGVTDNLPESERSRRYAERAVGSDVEYSRGYWLLRGEVMWVAWDAPSIRSPVIKSPLRAFSWSTEGRYRLRPDLYVAARGERIVFSDITGTLYGGEPTSWEADVSRIEVGAGYYVRRNIIAKVAYQQNWRDISNLSRGLAAAQLMYWF